MTKKKTARCAAFLRLVYSVVDFEDDPDVCRPAVFAQAPVFLVFLPRDIVVDVLEECEDCEEKRHADHEYERKVDEIMSSSDHDLEVYAHDPPQEHDSA